MNENYKNKLAMYIICGCECSIKGIYFKLAQWYVLRFDNYVCN